MAHPFFWAVVAAHIAVALFVLALGETPEKLGAITMLVALLLQWGIIFGLRAAGLQPAHYKASIDTAINLFASTAFLGVALLYPRSWLIVALLIQSGELALDGLFLEDEAGRQVFVAPQAYNILSGGLLALMSVAALASAIRGRFRTVRPAGSSSPMAARTAAA